MRVGMFDLDVNTRELHDGAMRIRLQSQPFEILCALLERPGDVVTRHELRDRLWPTGTFVDFEHSLNTAIKRLRAALGDDPRRPMFVETVPRRGYRYVAGEPAARPSSRTRLVVMPFSVGSAGVDCEHFSDGLTEEVIVHLAGAGGDVEILAPWSAGGPGATRARDLGELLHADFLLEGSARLEGVRVRITARLVDTVSEVHLWSKTYDRVVDCPMSVQADIGSSVASAILDELRPVRHPRRMERS
jgi:TolB-like protein